MKLKTSKTFTKRMRKKNKKKRSKGQIEKYNF